MGRVLIVGSGDVGGTLAVLLRTAGHDVTGLRRHPGDPHTLAADVTRPETLQLLPLDVEAVVYCVAAGGSSVEGYRAAYVDGPRNVLAALRARGCPVRRVIFTSSTAVYGQLDGSEVDETSPTTPAHFSGQVMLEGERVFLDGPHAAVVLRLGGIYGPGRTRLIDSVRQGTARRHAGPPRYTNRIHRDDAARAVQHLLQLAKPDALYVGVDTLPAPENEVLEWMATQLGVPPPPFADGEPAGQRGNKRCSSARLVASGFNFTWPTYREGYAPLLR